MKTKKEVHFSLWYDNVEGMVCVAFSSKVKTPEGWTPKTWYYTSDESVLFKDAEKQLIDAGFVKNKEFDIEIDQKIDNERSVGE